MNLTLGTEEAIFVPLYEIDCDFPNGRSMMFQCFACRRSRLPDNSVLPAASVGKWGYISRSKNRDKELNDNQNGHGTAGTECGGMSGIIGLDNAKGSATRGHIRNWGAAL